MYEQTLREKEKLIKALPPSPENDRLRLEAMVYISLLMAHQNTSCAIQMAQEALAEVPENDLKLRAFLFSALYRAYGMEGDIEKSAPAYRECLRLAQAAGQYGMVSNTTMIRAFDLCQYGRLDEAAHYCQMILDAGAKLKRKAFYPAGTSYIGLAGIHLERNELETAEDYLTRGLEICRQGGTYGLYTGYGQKARLYQAKGEFDQALAALQTLEQTLQRRDFTLTARQVSIRLAVGDTAGASRLASPVLEILGGSRYSQRLPLIAAEAFKLSLARIYIAQGDVDRACETLDDVQTTVEPGKRYGRLLEVHLLRALAEQQAHGGDISPQAIRYLERALALAEPAGFVLLFLEEGPPLIPLLKAVIHDRTVPDQSKAYAHKLMEAFGEPVSSLPPVEVGSLIEPLTPREMEVLQLVAAGDTNQTIADALFITVRTVKKHITNILGKLDVNNRTQAAARARELGLITSD
jgi:LuxR family maltose regulon positive regulatory protein